MLQLSIQREETSSNRAFISRLDELKFVKVGLQAKCICLPPSSGTQMGAKALISMA